MIVAIVGQALMLFAFAAAIAGVASTALGPRIGWQRSLAWGERSTQLLFASAGAGIVLLAMAFLRSNFALSYVAGRSNAALPFYYRLTAVWSGQEGSLLLWLTVLAGYGLLMQRSGRSSAVETRVADKVESIAPMMACATGVLCAVALFFATLVTFVARPFALAHTLARDGVGLAPALQNYWMAIHPPTLYLGYIGVTVPFALVMGAMLSRRKDDAWVRMTRRFTITAWIFLTLGLLVGARWAYEEIGWGGYWAWDPVENAALMPWLTATAFMHSIMVQERRGMMRYWNVLLVMLTFGLSIFGTFLTRSGILSSVHSFVSSSVGWWFIAFLAIVMVASMFVLFRSRGLLRARHDLETYVSREATFLFNNLLLVAIALMVLWGVTFPILTATFTGQRISLQAPWYNFFLVAFGLPLLVAMALGPLVPWQRAKARDVARAVRVPLAGAIVAGIVMIAFGMGSSWAGVAAMSFAVFVLGSIAMEFRRGAAAGRAVEEHLGWARSVARLFRRNRRRYGGYVSHAGLGLAVIAIAGSTAYTKVAERTLSPGQHVRIGSYVLTYRDSTRKRTPNSMQTRARFDVRRNGHAQGIVSAGKNFYPASGEISNEVGIRPHLLTGEDLYLIVDRIDEKGTAHVKVLVNPLVNLLWLAGLVVVGGAAVAGWPARRRVVTPTPAPRRVETLHDDLPELRDTAAAAGELLPGLRREPARSR